MATTETTPVTLAEVQQKLLEVVNRKADVMLNRNDPINDDENIIALVSLYNAIKDDVPSTTPDSVSGGSGSDTVTITGGSDTDTVTTGSDTDTTVGGDDTVESGSGTDTVTTGDGTDTTVGG